MKATDRLRALAMAYPETIETGVCVNAAFKAAGKKSFLFVGEKADTWNARLKLGPSLDEADALAARHPDNYDVGKMGWIKLVFPYGQAPPDDVLPRWVDESFRLLAPKKLLTRLEV